MLHIINEYKGIENGNHVYISACKLALASKVALKRGSPINIGLKDGQVCPECSSLIEGQGSHLNDDMVFHGGTTEDNNGISPIMHDQSHQQDGGRVLTKVSGIGEDLIKTEQGAEEYGALGSYGEYDLEDGHVGAEVHDPYGEGDVAEQRGVAAGAQGLPFQCPFQEGTYLYDRFKKGYETGVGKTSLGG